MLASFAEMATPNAAVAKIKLLQRLAFQGKLVEVDGIIERSDPNVSATEGLVDGLKDRFAVHPSRDLPGRGIVGQLE